MAADQNKDKNKKFLEFLCDSPNFRNYPDLQAIQKKIAEDGIDVHSVFEWQGNPTINLQDELTLHGEHARYRMQGSLLHYAVDHTDLPLTQWLIEQGLDVNAPLLVRYGKREDSDAPTIQFGSKRYVPSHTPLALAMPNLYPAPYHVPEIVEALLAAGADPNLAVDKDGKNTALDACVRGFGAYGGQAKFDLEKLNAEANRRTLAALLKAGTDPTAVLDSLITELGVRKRQCMEAVEKRERALAKGTLYKDAADDMGSNTALDDAIQRTGERMTDFKEALHLVLKRHIGQVISRSQQGRRLFGAGEMDAEKLAQDCDRAEMPGLAALVRDGVTSHDNFAVAVQGLFANGMEDPVPSLFAPDKWPDKPDLLHAYDETLARLQPEHAAFLQSRIDMTPIRREHTGRHGESWLARYAGQSGSVQANPPSTPVRR